LWGELRRPDGQALILTALIMPLLFGMAALCVDASSLFVQKRSIQNAADAAALAAGDELGPASDPSCQASMSCLANIDAKVAAAVGMYSSRNSGQSTVGKCVVATDTDCYTWPYAHDFARVEVRLKKSVPGVFTSAAGIQDRFDVSARAVAVAKPTVTQTPGTAIAIFAYAHNGTDPCSSPNGITVNGNPQTSIDAVLSNGGVTMNTTGTVGWAGYGPPPNNCPKAGTNQGNATWAQQSSVIDWPWKFDRTAVCTGHDSNSQVTLNNPAAGIYCSTVGISVTHLNGSYSLTLVAPVIDIPQGQGNNNFVLSAFNSGLDSANKDLVLWQYGNNQPLTIGGNNSAVAGVVWNENGALTYQGNSGVTGFYEAQSVTVTGNSYTMIGSGPAVGGTSQITGATATLSE
jgi:Putative Flp pilus-assembly TadE/G-like